MSVECYMYMYQLVNIIRRPNTIQKGKNMIDRNFSFRAKSIIIFITKLLLSGDFLKAILATSDLRLQRLAISPADTS